MCVDMGIVMGIVMLALARVCDTCLTHMCTHTSSLSTSTHPMHMSLRADFRIWQRCGNERKADPKQSTARLLQHWRQQYVRRVRVHACVHVCGRPRWIYATSTFFYVCLVTLGSPLLCACDYRRNRKHGDGFSARQRGIGPQVRRVYSTQLGDLLLAAYEDDTDGQPEDVVALVPERQRQRRLHQPWRRHMRCTDLHLCLRLHLSGGLQCCEEGL